MDCYARVLLHPVKGKEKAPLRRRQPSTHLFSLLFCVCFSSLCESFFLFSNRSFLSILDVFFSSSMEEVSL